MPWYARKFVNRHNPYLPVEVGNSEFYRFDLEKGQHKTRLFGPDYNRFLADYDMKPYDKIRFDILKHEASVMGMALDKDGYSKEKIAGLHVSLMWYCCIGSFFHC